MYYLLISLNILLAAFVAHLAVTFPSMDEMLASKTKAQSIRHYSHGSPRTVSASVQPVTIMESPVVTEERIAAVVKRNIFNTERVPEAPANRNNRNAQARQQVRAEMQLVGTFTVGDSVGAIILQRLQGNAQQIRELQQKEAEKNATSSSRVTDPKKVAAGEGREAASEGAEGDPKTKTVVAGNPAPSTSNTSTLYLKVGDTTVAGYKLVEVTEKTAVLTKNSERVELKLLPASEASTAVARQPNNRNNNNNRNNQQANNNDRNNNNNRNNQQANNNNRNQQNNNNRNNNNNNNRNQQNNNNRNNNNNNNRNQQNNNNRNNNNNRR